MKAFSMPTKCCNNGLGTIFGSQGSRPPLDLLDHYLIRKDIPVTTIHALRHSPRTTFPMSCNDDVAIDRSYSQLTFNCVEQVQDE